MTASADAEGTAAPSDAQLIAEVRAGAAEAYAQLFERHHSAAVGLARRYARNASDAEDLAAEGFANVLTALRGGSGPDAFFRAYLFTSIARLAARGNVKASRQTLSDDMERYEGEQPYDDPVLAGFESDAVSMAFSALPERWQAVLWYTEVDGMQPAAVAPLLGLSPNAVSALALRAREGLRQAYLQAHVATAAADDGCAPFADKLGAYARRGLSPRKEQKVRDHVEDCPRCSAALLELQDVGVGMRAVIFPLVTALPFAAGGAGKVVGGGLALGGGDWLRRVAGKAGVGNLVLIGVALAIVIAGGIAFASLGWDPREPPADAGQPRGSASSSAGAATGSPGSPLAPPPGEQEPPEGAPSTVPPEGGVPPEGALPGAVPPAPPVEELWPVTMVLTASPAPPRAPGTVASASPTAAPTASPTASPTAAPTASPTATFPYTLAGTLSRASGLPSTDTVQLRANPARKPSQPTEAVVTLRYSSLVQPAWSTPWTCSPVLDSAVPSTTLTCTTPFAGGPQIPPLTLDWGTATPPSLSGDAVLEQLLTTTVVSNVQAF